MDYYGQGSFVSMFPWKEYHELSNRIMVATIASLSVVMVALRVPCTIGEARVSHSGLATLLLFVYQGHEPATECSVCLSVFEDRDAARVLPNCEHSFHPECIDKWLGSNTTCPVCWAGAMLRLQLESCELPVRSCPLEMVTIRPEKPCCLASSSCLEGTSDAPTSTGATSGKAVTGSSSSWFGSIHRILSWEGPSPRTQSNSHEDGTGHDIQSQ